LTTMDFKNLMDTSHTSLHDLTSAISLSHIIIIFLTQ
jgi:hypothetical protein